jgi:hypothetical protein
MTTNIYLSGNPEHDRVLKAFCQGAPDAKLRMVEEYSPSDVAVVFGVFKKMVPISVHRGKIISRQKEHGLATVILETGYLNRGDGENNHYAAGLNGFNGRADFRNKDMPPDRRLVELKPWKQGDKIMLCGQVPWDASCDFSDHEAWLEKTVRALHLHTDREIIFRPHPKCKIPPLTGTTYSLNPLSQDLREAWAVVTFNSNTAVEAVIQGIPVFADDAGSMAMPVANVALSNIEDPWMPDRDQWLNDLCYTQWTPQEMREGKAWKHLMR